MQKPRDDADALELPPSDGDDGGAGPDDVEDDVLDGDEDDGGCDDEVAGDEVAAAFEVEEFDETLSDDDAEPSHDLESDLFEDDASDEYGWTDDGSEETGESFDDVLEEDPSSGEDDTGDEGLDLELMDAGVGIDFDVERVVGHDGQPIRAIGTEGLRLWFLSANRLGVRDGGKIEQLRGRGLDGGQGCTLAIDASEPRMVAVGTAAGEVLVSTDGGASFRESGFVAAKQGPVRVCMAGRSARRLWALDVDGGLYESTDAGEHFRRVTLSFAARNLATDGAGRLWVVGETNDGVVTVCRFGEAAPDVVRDVPLTRRAGKDLLRIAAMGHTVVVSSSGRGVDSQLTLSEDVGRTWAALGALSGDITPVLLSNDRSIAVHVARFDPKHLGPDVFRWNQVGWEPVLRGAGMTEARETAPCMVGVTVIESLGGNVLHIASDREIFEVRFTHGPRADS